MFSILIVGPAAPQIDALERVLPSVEVLRAHGAEEAVEKLGRNRRIDAVLLFGNLRESLALLTQIREDNPAPPPVFLPRPADADSPAPAGGRFVTGGSPEELLRRVVEEIGRE